MAMTPMHIATGMAVGVVFKNPLISIPIAFTSHFLFDLYPEWGNKDKKINTIDVISIFIEIVLGLATVYVLFLTKNWILYACAFAANFVDLWDFICKKITGKKMWFCHGGNFPFKINGWPFGEMMPLQTAFLDASIISLILCMIVLFK